MSRTLKDKPYDHRPKHHLKQHPRLLRNNYALCRYGFKCCGYSSKFFSARTVEKNSWKKANKENN